MLPPVFRFAPSPNGYLHLGHALSALINFDMARAMRGRLLLRIEDIDQTRCRTEFEQAIYEDLAWLGLAWEPQVLNYRERARRKAVGSPTYEAVSQPLYTRAIGRWKHYQKFLEPCLPILEPSIDAFGY
jgi:glutamyl-Q tRNA(Asp) synthetase